MKQLQTNILLDPSVYFAVLMGLIEDAAKVENRKTVKNWGIWIGKFLLILYLAACVWNVVAAVRDAILKAVEPIIAFWRFLNWCLRDANGA